MTRPPKTGGPRTASKKSSNHREGDAMGRAPKGGDGGPRKANRRGAARLAAVQALYQMDMTAAGLNEILAQFESHWLGREVEGEQYLPAEAAFFPDLLSRVGDPQRELAPPIRRPLPAPRAPQPIEANPP